MEKKLVSIITPSYNTGEFISKTINSVINQTYKNWEMIIVDDCSADNSIEIINNFKKEEPRIILLKNKQNIGSGPSRNKAIDLAKGEIIAFLDSDDIWFNEKLSLHVKFMEERQSAFSHTSYGFVNENGDRIKSTYRVSKKPISYSDLLKRTEISCLTAMYDVNKLGKMYMPDLAKKQDYALWLDILKKGVYSDPLDIELAYYRQRKGSATNNKIKLILDHWGFLYNREKISFFKSVYYLLSWGIRGFYKYFVK